MYAAGAAYVSVPTDMKMHDKVNQRARLMVSITCEGQKTGFTAALLELPARLRSLVCRGVRQHQAAHRHSRCPP